MRHGSTSPNRPRRSCGSLGAEPHDERHKGKSDASDILGKLDAAGALFPAEIDYKRLELDRRRWDTTSFAADLRDDADRLASAVLGMGDVPETIVNVPIRVVLQHDNGMLGVYVAVSTRPVTGVRSGLPFPLTPERFLLIQEGVREAIQRKIGQDVVSGEWLDMSVFGGGTEERAFVVFTELP